MSHSLTCHDVPGDPSVPESLAALAEQYLIWSEVHNFAANTVAIRRRHLARFIRWCDERSVTRAREVTPAMLERYQRHLFYYRKDEKATILPPPTIAAPVHPIVRRLRLRNA